MRFWVVLSSIAMAFIVAIPAGGCGERDDRGELVTSHRIVERRPGLCTHGPVGMVGPGAQPGLCEMEDVLGACQDGDRRIFVYTTEAWHSVRASCPGRFDDYCGFRCSPDSDPFSDIDEAPEEPFDDLEVVPAEDDPFAEP